MDIQLYNILNKIMRTTGLENVLVRTSNAANNRPDINELAINDGSTGFAIWQYYEGVGFTAPANQGISGLITHTINYDTGSVWKRITPLIDYYADSERYHIELGQFNSPKINRSFSLGYWSDTEANTVDNFVGNVIGLIGNGDDMSNRSNAFAFSDKGELLLNSIMNTTYISESSTITLDDHDIYYYAPTSSLITILLSDNLDNIGIKWKKRIYIEVDVNDPSSSFQINAASLGDLSTIKTNMQIYDEATTVLMSAKNTGNVLIFDIEHVNGTYIITNNSLTVSTYAEFQDLGWDNYMTPDSTVEPGKFALGRFGDDVSDNFVGKTIGTIGNGADKENRSTGTAFSDKGEILTNGIVYNNNSFDYSAASGEQSLTLNEHDMNTVIGNETDTNLNINVGGDYTKTPELITEDLVFAEGQLNGPAWVPDELEGTSLSTGLIWHLYNILAGGGDAQFTYESYAPDQDDRYIYVNNLPWYIKKMYITIQAWDTQGYVSVSSEFGSISTYGAAANTTVTDIEVPIIKNTRHIKFYRWSGSYGVKLQTIKFEKDIIDKSNSLNLQNSFQKAILIKGIPNLKISAGSDAEFVLNQIGEDPETSVGMVTGLIPIAEPTQFTMITITNPGIQIDGKWQIFLTESPFYSFNV